MLQQAVCYSFLINFFHIFILNSGAKIQKRNQIPPFGRFLFTHLADFRSLIWLIFVREFGLCPQKQAAATFFVMEGVAASVFGQ